MKAREPRQERAGHACDLGIWEGGGMRRTRQVQRQVGLHGKFQASQSYKMRLYLKINFLRKKGNQNISPDTAAYSCRTSTPTAESGELEFKATLGYLRPIPNGQQKRKKLSVQIPPKPHIYKL